MDIDPAIRIELFGQFRVTVRSRTIDDAEWRRGRAATLLKILALAPHGRLHREQVIDLMWPESEAHTGSNALHQVLHVARRILEPDARTPADFLRLRNDVVILSMEE